MSIQRKVAVALAATNHDRPEPGQLYNHLATVAITAFLEAATEQGWKLVPDKATEDMIKFGSEKERVGYYGAGVVYHTMLAAAPKFEVE